MLAKMVYYAQMNLCVISGQAPNSPRYNAWVRVVWDSLEPVSQVNKGISWYILLNRMWFTSIILLLFFFFFFFSFRKKKNWRTHGSIKMIDGSCCFMVPKDCRQWRAMRRAYVEVWDMANHPSDSIKLRFR